MGDQVNDPIDLELQLLPSRGSGARQTMQRVIRVVQCVQMFRMFLAGTNHERILPFYKISSSKSIDHDSSPEQYEQGRYETTEAVDQCVNSDQTAPLLDDTRHSRKLTERLIHVLHSTVAFKTNKTSEGKQEFEASDSLATSSDEHRVTIDQTTINQITVDQLHVSTIVHQKNFLELEKFGGLRGVESALCTDLINGISKIEAENRRRTETVSINLAPTHTFFQLISKEVKKTTISLLLLAVTLSTVFEINEEGLKYGWCDGVIVLIAIILQVLVASIRKYVKEKRTQKRLQEDQFEERGVGKVRVKREGNTEKLFESELVWGDLVLLKKGDEVPCDGLFVRGEELLELDRESESCIINEQNPFLSYGEKVINGDAIILVTSTNMKTEWGEMMSKTMGDSITWFKFEKQLDMLNTCMHVIQFIISILIVLVLAFRFMVGKIDDQNVYKPESFAEPTRMRSFGVNFKNIINEPTYKTKVLIKLLGVSLVGLTEGVPFVVSLAIVYWNDKILFGKGINEQDPNCVTKMAFVTRICTNDSFITGDKMEVEKHFIGGESISELVRPSHNIVKDALRDGIGTLKEKKFCHLKEKVGCNKQKGWKILKTMGVKSLEEPCGVLMKGTEESEDMVWQFNGPVKEILDMCKHYYDLEGNQSPLDDEMRQKILQANQIMKHEQLMTIAFACKRTHEHTLDVDNLSLIALLGLKNIKMEDTYAQIREFRERGIETVIVSSKKISVLRDKCEFGGSESLLITGEVFRNYTDDERLEKVDNIRLLCEARPSDKLLLVETMMKKGLVVAYLGHKTDEAPALIKANIGVAMETLSSKHVKGNCDIIIGDESFAHLINMVDSGKNIYYNIQSFLQIVLSMFINCNLISILETVAYGDASLTVFQLACVTYAVSFLGGLALLTKPSTDNLARHYPISCGQSVITVEMIRNIISQTLYLTICTLIIHLNDLGTDSQYNKAVVANIIIFCQFFNLFIAREQKKKNFFKGIHRHREFWVAIALFIVLHAGIDMVQDVLSYGTGLKWKLWVGCVLLGMVSWLVDWLGKCISGFIITFVYKLKGSTNMMKNLLRIC